MSADNHIKRLHNINCRATESSYKRLANSNDKIASADSAGFDGTESGFELICRFLCKEFGLEFKRPANDSESGLENLHEEMLYLCGLRHKSATLEKNWHKRAENPMIGELSDGTAVAIMPHSFWGWTVFHSKTQKRSRLTAGLAKDIKPNVTEIFRAFPNGKIALPNILKFIVTEHIGKDLLLMFACAFASSLLQIVSPLVSEAVFNDYIPSRERTLLFHAVIILICLGVADLGFGVIANLGITRIITKTGFSMETAVWDRLLNLKYPFFEQFPSNEISRMIKSFDDIRKKISLENVQALLGFLFAFVKVIVLFRFSAVIAANVVGMFTIVFVLYGVSKIYVYHLHLDLMKAENKSERFSRAMFDGMERIKNSCAEERFFDKWSVYETEKRMVSGKIKFLSDMERTFLLLFGLAAPVYVFVLIVASDILTGTFIAFVATFLMLQKAFTKFLKIADIVPVVLAHAKNISPLLGAKQEYAEDKMIPRNLTGKIEISRAAFFYGEYGGDIFRDVSFTVNEGECLGIVGASGMGKSTIMKLLLGLYPLKSGRIYYGGYDLNVIDLRYLRKQIGTVFQDFLPPVGEIFEILTDNHPQITEPDVWEALRKTGIADTVKKLPQGLHTRMDEWKLSIGEQRQILLAKLFLHEYRFLFLDEAFSHFDTTVSRKIFADLQEIPATKIIITHSQRIAQMCDRIIILEDGGIKASGAYEEVKELGISSVN